MKWSMVKVSSQPNAFLAASGSFRLAANDPADQVAPASTIDETTSLSTPPQLEADLRALPPAPLALALIPLLVLLLLALRPKTRFRDWFRTSSEDFWGLFRPLRRRRHMVHDKPYLDRVLEAEFRGRRPPSGSVRSSSTRPPSTSPSAEPPAKDDILPPSADEGRDRDS